MKFYQTNFDINSTYFFSDLHLYHNNFLKDYNFSNMESYVTFARKQIIETITEEQQTLGKPVEEACLFILGDICMKFTDDVINFIQSIPCHIFLLQGNHDNFKSNPECKTMFEVVADILDIQILGDSGQKHFVTLSHFPLMSWEKSSYGAIHLHGHMHGTQRPINLPNMYDTFFIGQGCKPRKLDYYTLIKTF